MGAVMNEATKAFMVALFVALCGQGLSCVDVPGGNPEQLPVPASDRPFFLEVVADRSLEAVVDEALPCIQEDYPHAVIRRTYAPDTATPEGLVTYRLFVVNYDAKADRPSRVYGVAIPKSRSAVVFADTLDCDGNGPGYLGIANIAAHELGHLFGRAHSIDPGSYMSIKQNCHWLNTVNQDGRE